LLLRLASLFSSLSKADSKSLQLFPGFSSRFTFPVLPGLFHLLYFPKLKVFLLYIIK
jgi:hypothetical protein